MLLCDFHIHSRFSDGQHSLREVVDFYGTAGFDAIAITDHLCEQKSLLGKAAFYLDRTLTKDSFTAYMNALAYEARRALKLYNMTVIPGVEITKNSFSHSDSAHILVLGLTSYIDPDLDIPQLLTQISDQKCASIAAHPVSTRKREPQTYYLWERRQQLANSFDAWEVASGPIWFDEVAQSGLPLIANSDLHHISQIKSWKTVARCENDAAKILNAIQKQDLDFIFYQGASHGITQHFRDTTKAAIC